MAQDYDADAAFRLLNKAHSYVFTALGAAIAELEEPSRTELIKEVRTNLQGLALLLPILPGDDQPFREIAHKKAVDLLASLEHVVLSYRYQDSDSSR